MRFLILFILLAISFSIYGQEDLMIEVARIDTITNIPVYAFEITTQDTLMETNYYFEENDYIRYYAYSHPYENISILPGIRYVTKKHDLQVGDTWNTWAGGPRISEVVDFTNISTACGNFLTAKVAKTDSITNEITRISYYSEDIGLVKTEFIDLSFTIELTDYTILGSNGYFPLYIGNWWNYSIDTNIIDNTLTLPPEIPVLKKNYPNPFNPSTTIEFSIQNDSNIELSIYNIKGQKIKTLIQNELTKGNHSIIWNGDDDKGNSVSSGLYLYKLNVNSQTEILKKCLLLK